MAYKSKFTGPEIDELLGKAHSLSTTPFIVLEKLPDAPEPGNEGKVHIVPTEGATEEDNRYTEWAWVNGCWEKWGEAAAGTGQGPLPEVATEEDIEGLF